MRPKVLVSALHLQRSIDSYRARFADWGLEIELPPITQGLREGDLLPIIERFSGAIVGDDEFSAAVLERAARLKVISKWGVGLDGIDLEAAIRLGIQVHNAAGMLADEVADVVVGYLVLLARHLHRLDQMVRGGLWPKIEGRTLRGKVLGIIGLGHIGRAVAHRASACGMVLLGTDPVPPPPTFLADHGLRLVELAELLRNADFVSLNCPLTAATRGLLGDPQFGMMKQGVCLINTARGGLIDEPALTRALDAGIVAGAALDVFEVEPLPADSPLRRFDQCIFGAHNASNTTDAIDRINEIAIRNLLDGLRGPARGSEGMSRRG